MPRFHFAGKLIDGREVSGVTSADDRADLDLRLLNRGVLLETCSPCLGRIGQAVLRHFKRQEITRVTRQLGLLLQSGISVIEALGLVREHVKDKWLGSVFDGIVAQIESGKPVAEAFEQAPVVFDEMYVSALKAGESSGQLDTAFGRLADYREKRETVATKVRSALAYPMLVILVAVMVVLALITYVVPVFSSMYENFGAELPALTQHVVAVSAFLRSTLVYWALGIMLLAIALFFAGLCVSVRRGWHRTLVAMPLVCNLMQRIVAARFARTMGALLTSGVDIMVALKTAADSTGNLHVRERLQPSMHLLAQGQPFTDAIASAGVFPKALLRLTASGEKTGRLGEMLTRAAEYYESETDTQVTTLTSLIEPAIIIFLGFFVAFILVAMYLPLFDLVGAV